ncbi:penicillin-binding protein 2 [Nocardioides marmoribigeumensis]|uniref:Penicillin-binding protein 2 n=1 Tax=Nocardioides marmoribigeumensis TaxID=433649 RepID=A0ABU2C0P4_9ACTN|nr:penicillin-binding protein 2 [Nocardioides marmoribigeumensis]MDR7364230.1 penicillin-binding protein 2 [Nocardioides marmoribigeumensis]
MATLTAFWSSGSPSTAGTRTRLVGRNRLWVIQVLVLMLFLTLLGRLWYLQVDSGADYQAKAADQSIREVVVQPARGLIVDDMGRPLVANRTSWVVTVDRTLLNRLDETQQDKLLRRIGKAVKQRPKVIRQRLVLCGQPGSVSGTCWNGSPYQPVPIAKDIRQRTALAIMEQNEDYPSVIVERQNVRAYPSPFGINAAHVLGYLSPITKDELDRAEAKGDESVHGASVVGRAGLEKEYDAYLRGFPGYKNVAVDSMGRVLGDSGEVKGKVGDTLVTSLDARVQSVVEQQLQQMIQVARGTMDPVTGRRYAADSGAAVVMEAKTGRVVAMASQPTYDPDVWTDGISSKQLERLYSTDAGTPLLSRATQGQFAPGSTWKPFMTIGALQNGYSQSTSLPCSSSFQVGNRPFKNFESGSYGNIGFQKALEVSCNTFFYRVGFNFWQKYGSDVADVNAKDPLVEIAKTFGFGKRTGIDVPGETTGRIADRRWKRAYYDSMKDYYCRIGKKPGYDFLHRFAREFCVEGYAYRAGDAVNFAIGQGDTAVTPIQLARGYAAISNGGTLFEPRVAKAIVGPDGKVVREIPPEVQAKVKISKSDLDFVRTGLSWVASEPHGTMNWRLQGFPLDKVHLHCKTGSAEVTGKQTTSWVACFDKEYVTVMMISQAGTGSGASGPGIRKIWEALYGIEGDKVRKRDAAIPGTKPPATLPVFARDGSILPPATRHHRAHPRAHRRATHAEGES